MLRKPAETTPSRPSIPSVRSVPSPDDPHRAAAVEARLDLAHPRLLGVPVEQAGVVDEVRVLRRATSPPARRPPRSGTRRRPSARRGCARACSPAPSPAGAPPPLVVELGARVHVLGRADRQPGVLVLDRVELDRRQLAEQLERRLERPVEVGAEAVGSPVDAREVVGAAAADRARDLLTSGRASGVARTETCQPGCTSRHRSTSSSASSATRGSVHGAAS